MGSDNTTTAHKPTDDSSLQQREKPETSNVSMVNVVKLGDFNSLANGTNTATQYLPHDFQIVGAANATKPGEQAQTAAQGQQSEQTKAGEQSKPGEQPKPAEQLPPGQEKHGDTIVKKDDKGEVKEYANSGYTLSKHDDGKWYYHQDGDGHDFVEVKGDSIKMDDQGKVSYNESGMFGKDNQTLGKGSTGFMSAITSAASNVEDAVVNHPLDTFNTIAFTPLAALDAVTGTHTIKAIGEIEKGAADEVIHHPGEILTDVAIGAAIGVATVATGGGALVALGIGAAAVAGTELVKNDGNIDGVINDAKSFGNTVANWGSDIATVAGPGQRSAEQEAAAEQGLHQLGAFGAHLAAGTAGGIAGGAGAEAVGLENALPNSIRSGVTRLRGASDEMPETGALPRANEPAEGGYPPPTGRDFEPGVLEAKLANLKDDLGIRSWYPKNMQREKLLADLDGSPRIQVTRNGDNVNIYNGNTRYALAKQLGIPDSEIPVWGGPNFTVKQFLRSDGNDPPTEPLGLPLGSDNPTGPVRLPNGSDTPTEPIRIPNGSNTPTEPIRLRLPDAGDGPTEPIQLASQLKPESANPAEPLENRGAFTLPNGESIDPHTIGLMKGAGLTQDSYVYRVMDPEYLDIENGMVAGNPESCASIYNPATPPRVFELPDGGRVEMPLSSNARDAGPGLNVALRNPDKFYGDSDKVLIGIRLGDILQSGGRLYRDTSSSMMDAFYATFDGSVPFNFI